MALDHRRYVESFAADSARLSAAGARDLAAAVPHCPGWRVADLLAHAGGVWAQKAAIIAERVPPGSGQPPEKPSPDDDDDYAVWHDWQRARLLDAFAGAAPDDRVWSWVEADQTVRFWGRRMAQEALVHRLDAERATGRVTPADPELVLDGVDEVGLFLAGSWRTPPGGDGSAVRIGAGGRHWLATVEHDEVHWSGGEGPSVATVHGEPLDVLLWVWGRAADGAVAIEGDRAAVARLRGLLRRATQ